MAAGNSILLRTMVMLKVIAHTARTRFRDSFITVGIHGCMRRVRNTTLFAIRIGRKLVVSGRVDPGGLTTRATAKGGSGGMLPEGGRQDGRVSGALRCGPVGTVLPPRKSRHEQEGKPNSIFPTRTIICLTSLFRMAPCAVPATLFGAERGFGRGNTFGLVSACCMRSAQGWLYPSSLVCNRATELG